jgi:2-methylisocitrate lyase-like PEP mutase family enzyme
MPMSHTVSAAARLRSLLDGRRPLLMPCCFDALSARLIEQAGFPLTFMSGFAVAATRLAMPDTGLISFAEMLDQGRNICAAVTIPVIGDGDTGYGNALNVKRTVAGYARAGFAAVMIEDQVAPKRCGHTGGKQVVPRAEAITRVRAAVDSREEGADILILARTDARATHGLAEAIARVAAFRAAGADLLFVEAPESEEEMRRICEEVPGRHLANMLEGGSTPLLSPVRLGGLAAPAGRHRTVPIVSPDCSSWLQNKVSRKGRPSAQRTMACAASVASSSIRCLSSVGSVASGSTLCSEISTLSVKARA